MTLVEAVYAHPVWTVEQLTEAKRPEEERMWTHYTRSEQVLRDTWHLYPSYCDVKREEVAETDARNLAFLQDLIGEERRTQAFGVPGDDLIPAQFRPRGACLQLAELVLHLCLGVGGGIIMVPGMALLMKTDLKVAVGTTLARARRRLVEDRQRQLLRRLHRDADGQLIVQAGQGWKRQGN